MNLEFKKAFKDVFNLKFFWVYIFIFTVITTLSSIIQAAKGMPYHTFISNVISIFTYVSIGYLYLMVNKLLNKKDLNDENEKFLESLLNSTKYGFKAFCGILVNAMFGFIIASLIAILGVFIFVKKTGIMITENNLFDYPALWGIFAVVTIFLIVYMLFILKLLPVAYSENFSLKTMFCWRKVLKEFFKKGNAKDTLKILGLYFAIVITAFLCLFVIIFTFNLTIIFIVKKLLMHHFVAAAFLLNISTVITPFIAGMVHYIISSVTYHLLGQIYGRKNIEE